MLLVFRIGGDMKKLTTPKYVDPCTGKEHQVEVLAKGQQFIAAGEHPDTGGYFRWEGNSPFDTPVEELPLVTEKECEEFIREAVELFKNEGWQIKVKDFSPKNNSGQKGAAHGGGDKSERIASTFQIVNNAALRNLGAWVHEIFPHAKWQPGTGAWRVSSESLGRDLEEDLSLHPDGIRDLGEEISHVAA